jgi:hypothetical protein
MEVTGLRLEFLRKSSSRLNALALVIDAVHEQELLVAYATRWREVREKPLLINV